MQGVEGGSKSDSSQLRLRARARRATAKFFSRIEEHTRKHACIVNAYRFVVLRIFTTKRVQKECTPAEVLGTCLSQLKSTPKLLHGTFASSPLFNSDRICFQLLFVWSHQASKASTVTKPPWLWLKLKIVRYACSAFHMVAEHFGAPRPCV